MLDKLISLSIDAAGKAADDVEVELWTTAPQAQAHFRLWNAAGRDPQKPPPVKDSPNRWLLGSARHLIGSTLTWSVRIAPLDAAARAYYELRLHVFQDKRLLPEGDFFYAGPLDRLEERTGSFHFRLKA